jgi:hypothetical protein
VSRLANKQNKQAIGLCGLLVMQIPVSQLGLRLLDRLKGLLGLLAWVKRVSGEHFIA